MSRATRSIGEQWEDFAAAEIRAVGLRILERRYGCRLGEIDLIAIDGNTLVFIEVRYRSRTAFGDAAASVTHQKQRRILNAARHFLMRHPEYAEHPIRMDVIALQEARETSAQDPRVTWIRAAFDAQQ